MRVPPVLGGDDEGHGRREGPTREGEVSRGEGGGTNILSCGSTGSHAEEQSYRRALIDVRFQLLRARAKHRDFPTVNVITAILSGG